MKMIKHSFLFLFAIALCFAASAQEITVKDFREISSDLTARTQNVRDINGELCALIKIVTPEKNFEFPTRTEKVEYKTGEVWAFVSPGIKYFTIRHKYGVLNSYAIPMAIEGGSVYEMVIQVDRPKTDEVELPQQQWVVFRVKPENAIVLLDGVALDVQNGLAQSFVQFGTYKYMVMASRYKTVEDSVTVDNPDQKKEVVVQLVPNFTTVTLQTANDVQLYIDKRIKKTGTTVLELDYGKHTIESSRNGTKTIVEVIEVVEGGATTFALEEPAIGYGRLNVISNPPDALIRIDGRDCGTTPNVVPNIAQGNHTIKLSLQGYEDYEQSLYIREGETLDIDVVMETEKEKPVAVQQETTQLKKKEAEKENRAIKKNFVLANVAYGFEPQLSYGLTYGQVKKFGWFLSVASNFNFSNIADCQISSDELAQSYPFLSGENGENGISTSKRLSVMAGGMICVAAPLNLKVGLGYGTRQKAWKTIDDEWLLITDNSYSGIDASLGAQLDFKGVSFSVDAVCNAFKAMELKLGVGINW